MATLQIPNLEKNYGQIIAVSLNPTLLRYFRDTVLADLEAELAEAKDEIEALVLRTELERKRKLFRVLIPKGEAHG